MKKTFITTALTVILFGTAFSQAEDLSFVNPNSPSLRHENAPHVPRFSNARVERSFVANFKDVKDVAWKETDENFIASFKKNDKLAIASFFKSGKLYCANYYGSAADLPENEHDLIGSAYKHYDITAVVQVIKSGKTAFVVTIRDANHYKKIKMVDGEYQEIETLKISGK